MADKRKLQSDIDRNLKRVQEGRLAFQEILDKFESTSNQTQKEKFEGDLKKEIKKLQRLRDQIKTWLTASEVKDKRPLLDARKEIEQDMERFKVIEKETKTKAYSKEGLLSTEVKKDPQQKEREKVDEFLKQCISTLSAKTDKYEFEIESLTNSSKKKRLDKETSSLISEKRRVLDMWLYHIEKLETALRLIDNERLDPSNVLDLEGSIQYVLEADEDGLPDFMNLYDDLHLDEIGDTSGITAGSSNVSALPTDIDGQTTSNSTHRSSVDDALSSTSTPTTTSSSSVDHHPIMHTGSTTSSNTSSSRERGLKSDDKSNSVQSAVVSTSTPIKSSSSNTTVQSKQKSSSMINQTAPSTLLATSTTPNKTRTNCDHQIPAKSKGQFDQHQSNEQVVSATVPDQDRNKATASSKRERHSSLTTTTTTVSSGDRPATTTNIPTPSSTPDTLHQHNNLTSQPRTITQPAWAQQPSLATALSNQQQSESVVSKSSLDPHRHQPVSLIVGGSKTLVSDSLAGSSNPPSINHVSSLASSSATAAADILSLTGGGGVKYSIPSLTHQPPPTGLTSQPSCVNQRLPVGSHPSSASSTRITNLIQMHPRDVAAPFRHPLVEKSNPNLPSELRMQLTGLEYALRRLPHPCDTEIWKNVLNDRNGLFYPTEPLSAMKSEEYYSELDAPTLFFIFYRFEGTKAQYLAAKALKRMSWRFHTKFMMWFQRHEEPKQITDEYESGSYVYYDFKTMSLLKKDPFTFHYAFLEDKDF